jgi:hypothetical protein
MNVGKNHVCAPQREREREREIIRCPGGMSGFNIWIIYLALKDTSPCRESEMGEMEEKKICRP